MTPANAKELSQGIKSELSRLGIDWKAVAYSDSLVNKVWKAPPLIHEGTLYGIDNRGLMQVSIPLTFDEFMYRYESHVESCNAGFSERFIDTRAAFRLTHDQALQLFPECSVDTLYNFVPALAALAYYNFEGVVEVMNYGSLVVSVGKFKFGLLNGNVMTSSGNVYCKVPPRKFLSPHIIYGRRRALSRSELATRLATLLGVAQGVASEPLHNMEQGMALLVANESEDVRSLWLLGRRGINSYPDAVLESLEVAKEFRNYQDPWLFLKEQLVPFVMTSQQFKQIFGLSRKTNPDRVAELDQGLDYLTNQINKERED